MTRVCIIGAGGHGREVADILRHRAQVEPGIEVVGFVDDDPSLLGQYRDGLPVLGSWSWFHDVDRDDLRVICASGSPSVVRGLVGRAREIGLSFASAISPLACLSPRAHVGEGVVAFPHVVVNTGARIGDFCTLNIGATVSHDSVIGPYSNINPGVHIAGSVSIGEGCYVGMGSHVIQRCSVGAGATIGAGAVVIRDIEANVTAVGVPARVVARKG